MTYKPNLNDKTLEDICKENSRMMRYLKRQGVHFSKYYEDGFFEIEITDLHWDITGMTGDRYYGLPIPEGYNPAKFVNQFGVNPNTNEYCMVFQGERNYDTYKAPVTERIAKPLFKYLYKLMKAEAMRKALQELEDKEVSRVMSGWYDTLDALKQ